jgi:RimJ/RimL family protein N-acetyltransferase
MTVILETKRLVLRNWRDGDLDLFREINRDPKVMEFFPFRRTPEQAGLMMDRIRAMIEETGLGFYAVAMKESAEPIGFCGLAKAGIAPILPEETVEIGWRLATRFWAMAMLLKRRVPSSNSDSRPRTCPKSLPSRLKPTNARLQSWSG